MSTVPYIFADNTGNILLSQLDADFANVKAFANTAGYVTANAQANITSVGTLSSLSVSGNVNAAGNITCGNITGIIAFATQPYITSVGTLLNLSVTGNITTVGSVISPVIITNLISSDDSTFLVVENGLDVNGEVVADSFTVANGTFKLPSLTALQLANIVAANGAMVYNSTQNKIQGYENGAWGNLI